MCNNFETLGVQIPVGGAEQVLKLSQIWRVVAAITALAVAGCASDDAVEIKRTIVVVGGAEPDVDTSPAQGSDNDNDSPIVITVGGGNPDPATQPDPDPVEQPSAIDQPSGITDLVLVTGQSNALGAQTAYDPTLDSPVDRFYAWTEDDGWQRASLRQVWDLGWNPRTHPAGDPHNNFGFHFGKRIVASDSSRVVGIVLATAPGEGISHWDYGSYFYNQIGNKAIAALNDLPHKSQFDGILWHQGETDWLRNGSSDPDLGGATVGNNYYSNKLYALIANLRSENWFSDGKPFICGETAQAPVNERLMALNTDADPWTACVSGEGLPTYDSPEYVHFTAEGLRELGAGYAQSYLRLVD